MTTLLKFFAKIIAIPLISLMTFAGVMPTNYGATVNPSIAAVFETSLSAPVASTDTTMTLASNVVDNAGDTLPNIYTCFTIDQGQPNNEFVCGTVSGTSVTGLTRGVSPLTGTSTVASLGQTHRRGADVKITDWPVLGILNNQLNGSQTISNPLIYYTHPCSVGSATTTICDKNYIDGQVVAGASAGNTSTAGIFMQATAGQAAASTATGVFNAITYNLLLGSNLSTSTPGNSTATGNIVATTGSKINQNFLDLTQPFTFSPTATITASSTSNLIASSTMYNLNVGKVIATSTISTPALTVNGVAVTGLNSPRFTFATSTADTLSTNTNTTSRFLGIAAGVLTASSTITYKLDFTFSNGTNTNSATWDIIDESGDVFSTFSIRFGAASGLSGTVNCSEDVSIQSSGNSASSQINTASGFCGTDPTNTGTIFSNTISSVSTSAVNLAAAHTFGVKMTGNTNVSATLTGYSITVNP